MLGEPAMMCISWQTVLFCQQKPSALLAKLSGRNLCQDGLDSHSHMVTKESLQHTSLCPHSRAELMTGMLRVSCCCWGLVCCCCCCSLDRLCEAQQLNQAGL
jgi:hypothetical protein